MDLPIRKNISQYDIRMLKKHYFHYLVELKYPLDFSKEKQRIHLVAEKNITDALDKVYQLLGLNRDIEGIKVAMWQLEDYNFDLNGFNYTLDIGEEMKEKMKQAPFVFFS